MSFYGNIADGAKSTNLTYDRIYPNRRDMDAAVNTDGVMIGRYVFVEYDDNTYDQKQAYKRVVDGKTTFYSDPECTVPFSLVKLENIPEDKVYLVSYGDLVYTFNEDKSTLDFYVISSWEENDELPDEEYIPKFVWIPNKPDISQSYDYMINYNIDKEKYYDEFGTGFDSTVWQKVILNNKLAYIMVAELNSKTPRFSLVLDAPNYENPTAPYFDPSSTNIEYILHTSPVWGFRVKEAETPEGKNSISDVKMTNKYWYYDEETGEQASKNSYDGAIYFHKEALDIEQVDGKEVAQLSKRYAKSDLPNMITITPTGVSGQKYFKASDPSKPWEVSEDIQELTVQLPILGDTVSEMWDLMYLDHYPDTGSEKEYRNFDVEWGSTAGARMIVSNLPVEEGGEDTELENNTERQFSNGWYWVPKQGLSVAGTINTTHDLMGMIIRDVSEKGQPINEAVEYWIYYGKLDNSEENKFFIKTRKNTYIPVEGTSLEGYKDGKRYYDLTEFEPNKYYIRIANNYFVESNTVPETDPIHYTITSTEVKLKPWIQEEEPENPNNPGSVLPPDSPDFNPEDPVETIRYHFYKDENGNYIKETSQVAVAGREYYTLTISQATSELTTPPIRVYNKYNKKTCYIGSYTQPNGEIDRDVYFYSGYLMFEKDADGNYTGTVKEMCEHQTYDTDAEDGSYYAGDLKFDVSDGNGNPQPMCDLGLDLIQKNYDYFWVENYRLERGNNQGGVKGYVLRDQSGTIFDEDHLPSGANDELVKFIDFKEETFYSEMVGGYKLLPVLTSDNSTWPTAETLYYHIEAELENGNIYSDENKDEADSLRKEIENLDPEDENYEDDKQALEKELEALKENIQYYTPNADTYLKDEFGNLILDDNGQKQNNPMPEYYYYRKGDSLDYYYGIEQNMIEGATYYKLEIEAHSDIKFYTPRTYYYDMTISNGTTTETISILDNSDEMKKAGSTTENGVTTTILAGTSPDGNSAVYYKKTLLYVINDPTGTLDQGAIWDTPIDDYEDLPEGLELGYLYDGQNVDENGKEYDGSWTEERIAEDKAKRQYEWKELKGFGRELNTINGLIVKLNQIFKFDDTLTRDKTTVQGCLNAMGDIINDFGDLIPRQHLVVDHYGRVNSVPTIDSDGKQIITNFYVNDDADAIIIERENVSNFTLTGYTNNNTSGINILSTDTINQAFAKVQTYVNELDYNNASTTQFISNITQTNGKISVSRAAAGTLLLGGEHDSNTSVVAANHNINQAFDAIEDKFDNAINSLDFTDTEKAFEYISAVNQTNGKISVTRKGTNTLQISSYTDATNNTKTIANGDSINNALYKIISRIEAEEKARASAINLLINDNDATDLDSIVDLVNWTATHGSEFATYKTATDTAINKNKQDIAAEVINRETAISSLTNGQVKTNKDNIEVLDEKIGNADSGLIHDIGAVDNRINELQTTIQSLNTTIEQLTERIVALENSATE